MVTASREGRLGEQPVRAGGGLDRESVEILLGTSLRLSGRVTDPVGRPIEGAEVSISKDEPRWSRTVRTDSRGRFLLEPLAPGTYGMSVRARRYVRRELPPRLLEASEEMQVTLKEAWPVAGHTVDERGALVEGVSLRLVRAEDEAGTEGSVATARSGADGAFALDAPEPGPWRVAERWRIAVSHPDHPRVEEVLEEGQREVTVVLEPGARVEGRITWADVPVRSGTVQPPGFRSMARRAHGQADERPAASPSLNSYKSRPSATVKGPPCP